MLRQRTRKQGRNSIANLTLLFLALAANNERIVKTLKPCGFTDSYAAMFAVMDKTPGAGIGKNWR